MKKIPYKPKQQSGFGYWGEYNEIPLGLSIGEIAVAEQFTAEKLHWHTKGLSYFIGLEGTGFVEVNGEEVRLAAKECLEISPGEKYRVLRGEDLPFRWLVVCTENVEGEKREE